MDNKPYVFISYAHLNSQQVLPCIQAMKRCGIQVWFDEGIAAGSEWPEYIAEKVVGCSKFVLFVSQAYLNSQNCKRELNFAISRKKEILSIFLEDVALSPGMEMQLGTYQSVYKSRFESTDAFHSFFEKEPFFYTCKVAATAAPQPQQPYRNPQPQQAYNPQQAARNPQPAYNPQQAARNPQPQQTYAPQQPYRNPQHTGSFSGYTGGAHASAYRPTPVQPVNQPAPTYRPTPVQPAPNTGLPAKNKVLAGVLAIFAGGFGVHHFYLGKTVRGIIYLLFCWAYVPAILGLIEGIILLCTSDADFCKKYKCRLG